MNEKKLRNIIFSSPVYLLFMYMMLWFYNGFLIWEGIHVLYAVIGIFSSILFLCFYTCLLLYEVKP